MKIIDLSHRIHNETPVYPGDTAVKINVERTWEDDGYRLSSLSCSMHSGTHIDAPSHLSSDKTTVSEISLDLCIGKGVLADVRNKVRIDAVDIEDLPISPGDIVVFLTGWSKYYGQSVYDDHPVLTESCAQVLVDRNVKMIALDMPSCDHDPYPVHRTLFEHGVLIAENLCNCEDLIGRKFQLFAIPIKIDAEGALSRVFALYED
jgi:kynurenine formamidase